MLTSRLSLETINNSNTVSANRCERKCQKSTVSATNKQRPPGSESESVELGLVVALPRPEPHARSIASSPSHHAVVLNNQHGVWHVIREIRPVLLQPPIRSEYPTKAKRASQHTRQSATPVDHERSSFANPPCDRPARRLSSARVSPHADATLVASVYLGSAL